MLQTLGESIMTRDGLKAAQSRPGCSSLISFWPVGIRCLSDSLRRFDESLSMLSLIDTSLEAGINER
jgi:hypothetical protein